MRRWLSRSVAETEAVGFGLAGELAPDGCLLLYADLGVGKTALARGIARGCGVSPEEVQSPTYTLVREHRGGNLTLSHLDLYRLSEAEVEAAGIEEMLCGPGVKVVEWAERLPFPVAGAVQFRMCKLAGGEREIVEIAERPVDLSRSGTNRKDGGGEQDVDS